MLKIYINETPLILATAEEAKTFKASKTQIVSRYIGRPKYLFHFIDNLEKDHQLDAIVAYHNNFEKLKNDFWGIFKVKEAAGGLVLNAQQQVLMIYRNGCWDMAKGHIEAGESQEQAAIREVQEETGLQNIELGDFLQTTYHVFRNKKNKRILKLSHWFKMSSRSDDNQDNLQPQIEEGIEKVEWMSIEKAQKCQPIYKNILDLLSIA